GARPAWWSPSLLRARRLRGRRVFVAVGLRSCAVVPLCLCCAKRDVAAVAERRLPGLLAAAERPREILRHGVAQRPVLGAAMRAVAIGLALAAAAGAPDDQFSGDHVSTIGAGRAAGRVPALGAWRPGPQAAS